MIFALVGNQNCGKTTLFNQLTGANQHVGNFPGVTVSSKIGEIKNLKDAQIVDLPGIYSIRPYSAEEIVTRDFIIKDKPNAIVNIVDATNIERNLYLTLQLLELKVPMVIALNMMDELSGNGGTVDVVKLSEALGVPVIPISAAKKQGIDDLLAAMNDTARKKVAPKRVDFCEQGAVHRCIHAVSHLIEDHAQAMDVSPRFAATKCIEGDALTEQLGLSQNEKETLEHTITEMEKECGMDRNAALADMRYTFIEKTCAETVIKAKVSREHQRSIKIDKVLTHKYFAIPIFIGIMMLIFYLTFEIIGAVLSDLLAMGIDALAGVVDKGLTSYGINPVVQSLIMDGIFAGVGSVLSFLPIIITLFFFLSILEDTGYMARIAFVMDKLLRKIGLSGKSIVPMLIGFGCSVPAIMATRTLSSERDRKMTVLLIPFMSCSAKIPIYAVFTAAFFSSYRGLVMTGLYVGGMVVAVLFALLCKHTRFRGNPTPFIMELPNYRLPSAKSVVLLMWEKAKDFIKKAFTVIFTATLIIWFLQTFDARLNVAATAETDSLLALIGKLLSPLFAPLGFADWRIVTALIAGFSAKEAVVSTLGVLIGVGVAELPASLNILFSPLTGVSFLVFSLLYTPCVAAVAAIKREFGSGLKAAFIVLLQCVIAYVVSFIVYRLGTLIGGLGQMKAGDWVVLAIIAVLFVAALTYNLRQRKRGVCVGCGSCSGCSDCASGACAECAMRDKEEPDNK